MNTFLVERDGLKKLGSEFNHVMRCISPDQKYNNSVSMIDENTKFERGVSSLHISRCCAESSEVARL